MRIEGSAEFAHVDKPFERLVAKVTITPETPEQHNELLRLVGHSDIYAKLSEKVGRLEIEFDVVENPAASIPDGTGDSSSLDQQLREVDIDPAGEFSPS